MTPIFADAINFPLVLGAGLMVLIPLMAFEVFVEAFALKKGLALAFAGKVRMVVDVDCDGKESTQGDSNFRVRQCTMHHHPAERTPAGCEECQYRPIADAGRNQSTGKICIPACGKLRNGATGEHEQ